MAQHRISPRWPPLVQEERFARNGMVPHAAFHRHMAEGFNFVAAHCKKQVFLKCQPLYAVEAGAVVGSVVVDVWPFYFRTGENTTGLRVAAGLAITEFDFVTAGFVPTARLRVHTAAGVLVIDESWKFAAPATGTAVAPDDIHHIQDLVTGLDPDTEYRALWQMSGGGRLVFASLSEAQSDVVDDAAGVICSPAGYTAEAPIYDADLAELVTANNELWRHNGAHLIQWCTEYDAGDAPDVTTFADRTVYTNLLDDTNTTVTATTRGWHLFTQYHNTTNRTTVPVKLAVRSNRTAGSGTLDVKLTDGTNSVTITGIADTAGWDTVAATIPAQNGGKWDLHVRVSDGSTNHEISAICLFEYEA
jgi:hypothetical protein